MALHVNLDVLAHLFSELPGLEPMVWDNVFHTPDCLVPAVYLASTCAGNEYAGAVGRTHNAQCHPWGSYRGAAFDGQSVPERRSATNRAIPPIFYPFYHLGIRLFRLVAQPFCAAWLCSRAGLVLL